MLSLDVLYIHTVTHRGWIDYIHFRLCTSFFVFSSAASKIARVSTENTTAGLISEVVYREDQPLMTQLLLCHCATTRSAIALATLVNTATKTESRMGSRHHGLPLTKVMQISQLSPCHTVECGFRALRTGNYSVVIGWLADDLTEEEHAELVDAANEGNAAGFIMPSGKVHPLTPRDNFPG